MIGMPEMWRNNLVAFILMKKKEKRKNIFKIYPLILRDWHIRKLNLEVGNPKTPKLVLSVHTGMKLQYCGDDFTAVQSTAASNH